MQIIVIKCVHGVYTFLTTHFCQVGCSFVETIMMNLVFWEAGRYRKGYVWGVVFVRLGLGLCYGGRGSTGRCGHRGVNVLDCVVT